MTNVASVASFTPAIVNPSLASIAGATVTIPAPQVSVTATAPVIAAVATNANTNTPATYTALANESTPTIRGTNLNTAA